MIKSSAYIHFQESNSAFSRLILLDSRMIWKSLREKMTSKIRAEARLKTSKMKAKSNDFPKQWIQLLASPMT